MKTDLYSNGPLDHIKGDRWKLIHYPPQEIRSYQGNLG
jgi:hypothetical protein